MTIRPSITTKLINAFLICICLDLVFLSGYLLQNIPEFIPYIYPILMLISFCGYKVSGVKIPFYFMVGQLFLFASALTKGLAVETVIVALIVVTAAVCVISIAKSVRKGFCLKTESTILDVWEYNRENYRLNFEFFIINLFLCHFVLHLHIFSYKSVKEKCQVLLLLTACSATRS